ncbi:MAG: GNAT family N-acetyltransferase [Acidobacteriia bacterium]|nr:GNAT family N-acetyltransferase [Terriglobia bacterium]
MQTDAGRDFQVVPRAAIPTADWNGLAAASGEAWLWHTYEYQDCMALVPGFADAGFGMVDPNNGGSLVAIVPAYLKTHSRSPLLESRGGPALSGGLSRKQRKSVIAFVRSAMFAAARKVSASVVDLTMASLASMDARINPLFYYGVADTSSQTSIIDLTQPETVLWERMEKRTRNAVTYASKKNLEIAGAVAADFPVFRDLMRETVTRTGSNFADSHYKALWDSFLGPGMLRGYLACEKGGGAVSVATVGVYKNRANYWNGGETRRGLACQSQTFLLWHIIRQLKSSGVTCLEMGEVSPLQTNDKKGAIGNFKKSFGGDLYPIYQGRLYCDAWGPVRRDLSALRRDLVRFLRGQAPQ